MVRRWGAVVRGVLAVVCVAFLSLPQAAEAQSGKLWRSFAAGEVVGLMRHAIAPVTKKKKPKFSFEDCATQRNLSRAGRDQARRTGAYFRGKGIKTATIYTSEYCRCMHTAQLLGLGSAIIDSSLNMVPRGTRAGYLTDGLARLIRTAATGSATIIVTHKTNIRALTGKSVASGETVLVNRSGRVVGRIGPR